MCQTGLSYDRHMHRQIQFSVIYNYEYTLPREEMGQTPNPNQCQVRLVTEGEPDKGTDCKQKSGRVSR